MPRPTKTALLILAGWVAAACVPPSSAYLTIPIVPTGSEDLELAVVEVSLEEIRSRIGEIEPGQLAFYNLGRDPIPHQLRDTDDDGVFDIAVVAIPVPTDGTSLFAVCPGTPSAEPLPLGGVEGAVLVQYELSYR